MEMDVLVVLMLAVSAVNIIANPTPSCYNDYDRTMVCSISPLQSHICSGYTIAFQSMLQGIEGIYTCTFTSNSADSCLCSAHMPPFVVDEMYTAVLQYGGRTIYSTEITPSMQIKPRTPQITSVSQQQNENYMVKWDKNYTSESFLNECLQFQLSYRVKGEPDENAKFVNCSAQEQQLLRGNLRETAVYVIKVRSYCKKYNTMFSDWSPEVELNIPLHISTILKMITPAVCVFVILICCMGYYSFQRLHFKGCGKVPKPSVGSVHHIYKEVVFPVYPTVISMLVATPKLKIQEKKSSYDDYSTKLKKDHETSSQSVFPCTYSATQPLVPSPFTKTEEALSQIFAIHNIEIPIQGDLTHNKNTEQTSIRRSSLQSYPGDSGGSGLSSQTYACVAGSPNSMRVPEKEVCDNWSQPHDPTEPLLAAISTFNPLVECKRQPLDGNRAITLPLGISAKEELFNLLNCSPVMSSDRCRNEDDDYKCFDVVAKSNQPHGIDILNKERLVCNENPAYGGLIPSTEDYQAVQNKVPNSTVDQHLGLTMASGFLPCLNSLPTMVIGDYHPC